MSSPSLYDLFLKLHQHFPIISNESVKSKLWVFSQNMYFYSAALHLIKILFLTQFNNKTSFTCDPSSISHCESIGSDHGLGEWFTVCDHSEVIGSRARGETQVVECDGRVGADLRVGHHIVAGLVKSSVCPQSHFIVSYLLTSVLRLQLGLISLNSRVSYGNTDRPLLS